jgi:hypothetical protein
MDQHGTNIANKGKREPAAHLHVMHPVVTLGPKARLLLIAITD